MTHDIPPSPLLSQIRADQQETRAMLAALARACTMGHREQPQLYKAFRDLGWQDAFNVFLASFRAASQYARLAHSLDKLQAAGHIDDERLTALIRGRARIVAIPPEEWPLEEKAR